MLYLNQTVSVQLKSIAERNHEECCGFLFGYEQDEQRMITALMEVRNVSPVNRERTFQISSKDYMHAENFADRNNLKFLGIFHSHPNGPAIPSELDRMAAQPYFSYLILSVTDKKVNALRSWRLNKNYQFDEESLSTLNINQHIHGYCNHPNTAA